MSGQRGLCWFLLQKLSWCWKEVLEGIELDEATFSPTDSLIVLSLNIPDTFGKAIVVLYVEKGEIFVGDTIVSGLWGNWPVNVMSVVDARVVRMEMVHRNQKRILDLELRPWDGDTLHLDPRSRE